MKLTITLRFVALSTIVVALIFVLFNSFVYLEFMNVTIQNEKQVVSARIVDVYRRIDGDTVADAVAEVKRIVPDPRQMVELISARGQVLTSSGVSFQTDWVPRGLRDSTDLGQGVLLFQYADQRVLVASRRVHLLDGDVTVQWLENVESLDQSIAFVFYLLLTGSIGGLVLAAVASYFLARYSLLPIRELIATARSITPGDLSSRIDVPKRKDELTELGHTFNAMLDRLFLAFTRERQFIADASHELRTPLSVLEGYVHILRRWGWENSEVRQESVEAIEGEVKHLRNMLNQLLTLAAIDSDLAAEEPVISASEVVERTTKKWIRLYPEYHWSLSIGAADETQVRMSDVRLEQVLRALLDNARKYTPEGGSIQVSVARIEGRVYLAVRDSGLGIPEEDIPHVTERFYRADKARSRQEGGVGLGLAICREIVEAMQGELAVRNRTEGGTEVEVMLLAATDEKGKT